MKVDKPQLRFSTFDEYWVGAKLSKLGSFLGGGTPDTNNAAYWTGHIGWLSSADVIDNTLFVKPKKYITEAAIKASATKLVPQNSLLFVSRVGVGKLAINSSPVCTSQDFTNFTPTSVEVSFLGYYFQANKNLLKRYSQGTTIKGLTKDVVESIYVSFPESNNEQLKIADFLSSVDTKIRQLTEKYRLFKEYKKGVMQQIFSQQIRFKDKNGGAFPDWNEYALKEILLLQSDSLSMGDEETYELITVKRGFGGVKSRGHFKGRDVLVKNQFTIHENEFVISKRQIVHGACGLVPSELDGAIVSNEYNVLHRNNHKLDRMFEQWYNKRII